MSALPRGARLGPYEIDAPLGAGGMGDVYRARDTRLGRTVAIKLLNAELSGDAVSRERFEREARSIATLTHPHVCTLHDIGDHDGAAFLVMELLQGDTLAARLARTKGGLPIDEGLTIAAQVAEALAFAHRHQIVHRDIKPANIMLTPNAVKLLDFGLARLRDRDEVSAESRTHSSLSEPHGVMGTLAYMAPEQLDGRTDQRSDIFAFGAVLFEMFTGRKAFAGETTSAVIGAIVHTDPPAVSSLRSAASKALDRVVRRCLAKDPDARWQSAADLVDELRWIANQAPPDDQTAEAPSRRVRVLSVLAAALAVALLAVLISSAPWRAAAIPPSSETRTEILTPTTDDPSSFALSPDGRQIVFVAASENGSRLWLRSLAATTAQPLAGTEGATSPFWSPDSRSVGFFAANSLKRLDLGGGALQTLAPIIVTRGGTWNAEGVIVFAPNTIGPLMRTSATGSNVTAATVLGPRQTGHMWPSALPDGRQFLFYVQGAADASGIYLGALDGSAPARLAPADSAGLFLMAGAGSTESFRGDGWLLWVRSGSLVAQRLDVEQGKLTGEPIALADGVAVARFRASISAAAAGAIAYRPEGNHLRQLTWVDRSGTARGTIGDPDRNDLTAPRVSPDGSRVVVSRKVQGNIDVWLLDGAVASRLTFDAAADLYPLWSPDGTRIVFRSNRSGRFFDLYQKPSSGGAEERIVASDQHKAATSWSADGRFLLYPSFDSQTNNDLWVVPMQGDRTPAVFLKTPFSEGFATFSPDGRWVAYDSNESGQMQIYIRPFVPPGSRGAAAAQWQVSTSGGMYPVWRPDGKELYYIDSFGTMMAAPIVVTGATLEPGAPVRLFQTRIVGGGGDTGQGRYYDVARNGRFLINTVLDGAAAPITLVMNWRPPS
jgi:serine/threonine protein kinase